MVLAHETVHQSEVLRPGHSRADRRCAGYSLAYSIQIQSR